MPTAPGASGGTGTGRAGVMVQDVVPDGPAAQAGLAAGDLITVVDAQSITTVDELSDLLKAHDVGDRIAIDWSDSSGTGPPGDDHPGRQPHRLSQPGEPGPGGSRPSSCSAVSGFRLAPALALGSARLSHPV